MATPHGDASEMSTTLESRIATDELFEPGLGARLTARLRHRNLDHELAEGANPAACPQWAARAAELTKRTARARVADELERMARFADEPLGRLRIGPHRAAARSNRQQLFEIAAMLRGDAPLYAQGLARLAVAMADGSGPFYTDARGDALARQLREVMAALAGTEAVIS